MNDEARFVELLFPSLAAAGGILLWQSLKQGPANLRAWMLTAVLAAVLSGCANNPPPRRPSEPLPSRAPAPAPALQPQMLPSPPAPAREMRGVWVATVRNIDWPSKPGLSVAQQQAELTNLFNLAASLKFNAVILQIRPESDALYASALEPWSATLSGRMGQPPPAAYDPLQFAVAQAHQRNLELHAWFNPFRALIKGTSTPTSNHISRTHPEWMVDYGKFLWINPARPDAREHILDVIRDVVRRYDIDGVQFDDYFYPDPETNAAGKKLPFNDDTAWRTYQAGGGSLSRADWRRSNIDAFVQGAYRVVKQEKPWVKFGISPRGMWTNSYANVFADPHRWLSNGWVDYLSPQLYWSDQVPGRAYAGLLRDWVASNPLHRHLWPGHFDSEIGADNPPKMTTQDIVRQIETTRRQPGASGDLHYSAIALLQNRGGLDNELARLYARPALVPSSPWLSWIAPAKPSLSSQWTARGLRLSWQPAAGAASWQWVLQMKIAGDWSMTVFPGNVSACVIPSAATAPQAFAVSALDRYGNLSPPAVLPYPAR